MKSIFDLKETTVAALSYLFGPITGIAALVLERENKFVRFHALQSTLWFLFMWIIFWVLGIFTGLPIPILGGLLRFVLAPVGWAWWLLFIGSRLFLMLKASLGKETKIPILGEVVWNQINK